MRCHILFLKFFFCFKQFPSSLHPVTFSFIHSLSACKISLSLSLSLPYIPSLFLVLASFFCTLTNHFSVLYFLSFGELRLPSFFVSAARPSGRKRLNDDLQPFSFMPRTGKCGPSFSQICLPLLFLCKMSGNLYRKTTNQNVFLVLLDHGSRFGKFRSTYLGKLEERLPFMFLLFPKWFIQRYPEIDKVLKINSYRLTTPFDIYETLVDILYFDGKVQKATIKDRGISLFHEIPEERSCNDASILPHWCTCLQRIPVNTTDVIVEKIALSFVNRINKMTHHVQKKCAFLQLKTVKEAAKMIATDKILRFQKSLNDVLNQQVFYGNRVDAIVDYQLTIETTPGGAQFETTARYDEQEGTFTLMEEVSRVNSYGSQSSCIDILALKMYCFCGG
ncbi:unnamed protein product [Acanthosepion pharaonis]|uniref:Uncharacterized protein n=1 Tax=Acanthosepion pharaonis TaxID=158019 RepID=A0A812BHD1_ACAPH|nr:unnamed protein product [Sepia pharaonis]